MDWQAISEFLGSAAGEAAVRLLRITGILLGAWILAMLLRRAGKAFRMHVERHVPTEQAIRVETLARVFRYTMTVVVTLVATVLVLPQLGISVAPILGAAGVVGVAIGFGAQNLVKDFFTGLFLLLENQLRVGDVVTIAGLSGQVEDITLRHVRLRDYDGHVHYVSNGLITTVTNRTHGFAYAVVDVSVAYGEPLDEVMKVMREVGGQLAADPQYRGSILEPLEIAGVDSLGSLAVVIKGRFKVRGPEQWTVRREYLRRLMAAFARAGIGVPLGAHTIYKGPARSDALPAADTGAEASSS